MNPERWRRVKQLFYEAIALSDPVQRSACLDDVCGSDQALRSQVEQLLQAPGRLLAPFDSLPGRVIGNYEVLEEIGRGSTGVVCRACDRRLGRVVALKVLPPQRLADADAVRRFRQEAHCLSALQHPHVVTIFELQETTEALCLVMEHVPGKTLAEHLGAGALATETALAYASQIAQALAAAHEQGIIHRDLKPSNILVTENGQTKVVDFGLAKFAGPLSGAQEGRTLDGTILGTADYMAPEQARGQAADQRSDVFSFGTLFYEMLTGRRPFRRGSVVETMSAVLRDPVPDPDPSVPKPVHRILQRCLAKAPEQRYQTGDELARDLKSVQATVRVRSPRRRIKRRLRRRFAMGAAMACVMVLGAAIGWRVAGTRLVTAANQADVPAALFDRALALHEKAIAGGCFQNHTDPCDFKMTRSLLDAALADWDQLGRSRPHHASSLWNKALSEQAFCHLLGRTQDWPAASGACEQAIEHFGESLLPGSFYSDLPRQRPDQADVLWNRGLTHAMRARLPDLDTEAKQMRFSLAIADFDRILHGPPAYTTFLRNRRGEVDRERAAVAKECAALLADAAR
jgi:hypothetical protein